MYPFNVRKRWQGNPDGEDGLPNSAEGIICVHGLANANLPSLPERLTKPSKLAGKHGE